MNKKVSIVREVWIGLVLVLFSVYFLFQCNELNQKAAQYPRIIISVLLALSVALLIQGIYYTFKPESYYKRYGKDNKSVEWGVVIHPLMVFGVTVIYLALFYFTNFFIATAVFVPLLMFTFGERKILPMLLTTVGMEAFVYLLFVKMLNVYFPL